MTGQTDKRFANLRFEDFRRMADDDSLTAVEKIGFPESYRAGKEPAIFRDLLQKLPQLSLKERTVLDIGPGCSELPRMLIDLCRENHHELVLVDSSEMLSHLPDESFIKKFSACYPNCEPLFAKYTGRVDVIISYSVLHYVFAEGNVWDFLDSSLALLSPGGELLIGDIPNISLRRRFFSSPAGIEFHKQFMNTTAEPEVNFNRIERDQIDDSVVLGLISRARNQGFESYLLPQPADLPMANRREDILIRRH